jgi:hypothetical protein
MKIWQRETWLLYDKSLRETFEVPDDRWFLTPSTPSALYENMRCESTLTLSFSQESIFHSAEFFISSSQPFFHTISSRP